MYRFKSKAQQELKGTIKSSEDKQIEIEELKKKVERVETQVSSLAPVGEQISKPVGSEFEKMETELEKVKQEHQTLLEDWQKQGDTIKVLNDANEKLHRSQADLVTDIRI